jgi:hypothetical protein
MRDRIPQHGPTRRAFVVTAAISTAAMLLTRSSTAAPLKSNDAFPDERHNNQNQEGVMNTITVKDGTKIYYKDWGTGQPIVFSHGWPLNADAWDAQMLFLSQHGYRVIAHDRRGHGRSEQTWEGNEMNTYADDLASPKAESVEINLRAQSIQAAILSARAARKSTPTARAVTIIYPFPESVSPREVADAAALFEKQALQMGVLSHTTQIQGTGFIGLDGVSDRDDASIQTFIQQFFANELQRSELHPDAWDPITVHDPAETLAKLSTVAGDKYSYAELDDFSDLIARTLQGAPETSKVERRGVQQQTIYLEFSQDKLAAYGLQPADLGKLIQARNIIAPGGVFESGQRQITLNPSGQFESPKAIGDIVVTTAAGAPVYLRDLVNITRGYQSPANYLNYYTWQDAEGNWRRSRAVTIAIYMRDSQQIAKFG